MSTADLILTPRRPALLAGFDNRLDLLVRLRAPEPPATAGRARLNLALVIDRSGSMAGEPLEEAKRCALHVVDRLAPTDRLALVAYDHRAELLAPARPVDDRAALRRAVSAIDDRGATDLHAGWLAGAEAIAPFAAPGATSRVALLSDGRANRGVTDPGVILARCRELAAAGVTTSTYGLGPAFNEELMIGMARVGGGSSYYGRTAADLLDPFAEELDLLAALHGRGPSLWLAPAGGVRAEVLNGHPELSPGVWRLPDLAYV